MGPERENLQEKPNFFPDPEVLRKKLEESPYKGDILAFLDKYRVPVSVLLTWPDQRSSPLPDLGIIRHLLAGNIVIDPFSVDQLTPNSYDVILGEYFFRERGRIEHPPILESPRHGLKSLVATEKYDAALPMYNPYDPLNVDYFWREDKPIRIKDLSVKQKSEIELKGLDDEDLIVILEPHENILGHTEEFIGGLNVVATRISAKSSTGRSMLEVCNDADMGHIGFRSRWTLEIRNKSDTHAIFLVVGQPYAQLEFSETEPSAQSYQGAYQRYPNLEVEKKNWRPRDILPQVKRR